MHSRRAEPVEAGVRRAEHVRLPVPAKLTTARPARPIRARLSLRGSRSSARRELRRSWRALGAVSERAGTRLSNCRISVTAPDSGEPPDVLMTPSGEAAPSLGFGDEARPED